MQAGQVLGPVGPEAAGAVQVNRFSFVPKNHQPSKWRLIVDLSFPRGHSVNDGIEPNLCNLHYTSTDEACKKVVAKERGTCLAKFDVEGAFRTVPVHQVVAGHAVERLDKVLPFGLRLAPKIYNAIADAHMWIFEHLDRVEVIMISWFLGHRAPVSANRH